MSGCVGGGQRGSCGVRDVLLATGRRMALRLRCIPDLTLAMAWLPDWVGQQPGKGAAREARLPVTSSWDDGSTLRNQGSWARTWCRTQPPCSQLAAAPSPPTRPPLLPASPQPPTHSRTLGLMQGRMAEWSIAERRWWPPWRVFLSTPSANTVLVHPSPPPAAGPAAAAAATAAPWPPLPSPPPPPKQARQRIVQGICSGCVARSPSPPAPSLSAFL